jgi:chemotaxis protein MotB
MDTNRWITTYTDLMTLLLTFFVLLLSISVIDSRRQRQALNSLVGAFGFKPGAHSVMGVEKGTNITVGAAPIAKEQADFERLRNISFKNGLESAVKIKHESERIILTLGNKIMFSQGSAAINPNYFKFLKEIAEVLKDAPGLLELRGYADLAEAVLESDPFKKGMYLSSKRALAVYHFLKDRGEVPIDKMVAHGFGTNPPKKLEPAGREEINRQVEIICDYRAQIPYRLRHKRTPKNIFLDFKGFLFNLKEGPDG